MSGDRALHGLRHVRREHSIDYLGAALLVVAVSSLLLGLVLGGGDGWTSPQILSYLIGGAVLSVVFVWWEGRATEPILPLRLFRGQVFSVSVILAFIVGFAMLGAMTFLPTYLQYVRGISATGSGIRTLPMVLGLLVTSIAAGTVVGRTGRYKVFPIAGTLLMALGLFLLSRMDEHTGFWEMAAYMLVLGAGIGLSMQILTLVVQNTSAFQDLGVATSGVTFFRTLGSSFGAAIFGSVTVSSAGVEPAAGGLAAISSAPPSSRPPDSISSNR